jgi:anti-sigma B factor antagonist
MLKAFVEERDGFMIGIVDGRLDTPSTPLAEKGLAPLLSCSDKDIIIDCTDMNYIASSGLRLFLDILKNAKANGHHVYIKNISDNIREAFTLTGFIDLFEYI